MSATIETETRTYQENYELRLGAELDRTIKSWIQAGPKAVQEYATKMLKESKGFRHEGPFGYAVRWNGDSIIQAETKTVIAQAMVDVMENGKTPAQAIELAKGRLRNMIAEGLRSSSTIRFNNVVHLTIGKAALELSDDLDRISDYAEWDAAGDTFPMEQAYVRSLKDLLQERRRKYDRARSEASIMKLGMEIETLQNRLDLAQGDLDQKLVSAKATII